MAAKQKTKPRATGELEEKGLASVEPAPAAFGGMPAGIGLKLLVFVSGAVLMGLEIVGSRLLAPYFGNSVFVWGSLISLFLIALSAGYYLGGMLADRRPSRALLNGIVIAVGASLFIVAAISGGVCTEIVEGGYGEKSGPFLAATVLFLLPSIGMGMVSPFAVRLATHTVASVGKTAGTLYALSTVGSIAGTMITTFVLIPSMGAESILKGLAGALLAAAVATYPFVSRKGAAILAAIAACGTALSAYAINPARIQLTPGSKIVMDVDTPYHHITVIEGPGEMRQLRFDRFTESAVKTTPPYESLSAYTRYFNLAFLAQPKIRRALFIGAGGGCGPHAFHMHDPEMQIEVVDIDAKVLEAAKTQFFMEDSPNIKTIAADGRMYVRSAENGAYDCIILDAFSIGGRIPFHLVTREFMEMCRERLAPGGVFMMNINSALMGPKSQIFQSMYKTVESVYPETAQAFFLPQTGAGRDVSSNVILVGINRDQTMTAADWKSRAREYMSESYINRDQIVQMVGDLVETLPNLSQATAFTDDFAPIETMAF